RLRRYRRSADLLAYRVSPDAVALLDERIYGHGALPDVSGRGIVARVDVNLLPLYRLARLDEPDRFQQTPCGSRISRQGRERILCADELTPHDFERRILHVFPEIG